MLPSATIVVSSCSFKLKRGSLVRHRMGTVIDLTCDLHERDDPEVIDLTRSKRRRLSQSFRPPTASYSDCEVVEPEAPAVDSAHRDLGEDEELAVLHSKPGIVRSRDDCRAALQSFMSLPMLGRRLKTCSSSLASGPTLLHACKTVYLSSRLDAINLHLGAVQEWNIDLPHTREHCGSHAFSTAPKATNALFCAQVTRSADCVGFCSSSLLATPLSDLAEQCQLGWYWCSRSVSALCASARQPCAKPGATVRSVLLTTEQ